MSPDLSDGEWAALAALAGAWHVRQSLVLLSGSQHQLPFASIIARANPSERIELSIREVERLCVKRGRREHGLLEERHEGDENSG